MQDIKKVRSEIYGRSLASVKRNHVVAIDDFEITQTDVDAPDVPMTVSAVSSMKHVSDNLARCGTSKKKLASP